MRVVADHLRADDVPDQRRRHPVERMARLRAAQDHAAGDAARQAARPARSVPAPPRRRGRRASSAAPTPTCRAAATPSSTWSRARRSASTRCSPPACRASRSCSIAPRRRPTAACPATRCSASTTRSACRSTSSRIWPASASSARSRRATSRRWKASASGPVPAARFDQKKAAGFTFASDARAGRARADARSLRRLRHDRDRRRHRRRAVRRRAGSGRGAEPPARRASSSPTARRSISRPAARCPMPARSPPRPAKRPSTASCGVVPGGPRAHRVTVTSGLLEAGGRVRLARRRRRGATRSAAITPPRTCCTRRCARCSGRTSSRPARWWRRIACASTSCSRRRFRPRRSRRIERIVNDEVLKNTAVTTEVKPTAEAMAAGAMALFGEKYGDTVRVVSIPGFSLELCGGTHVRATGDIGLFAITAESGVAAGVRRVEAVTGTGAYEQFSAQQRGYHELLHALGAEAGQAKAAVERLQADVKRLTRELQDAKVKAAMGGGRRRGGRWRRPDRAERRLAHRPPGRRSRPGRTAHSGRLAQGPAGLRRRGAGLGGRRQGVPGRLGDQGPDRQSAGRSGG